MIKKSLIALGLIALVSANSHAQRDSHEPRGPRGSHDPIARMTEELQLDETQAVQLADIMSEAHAQHEALQTTERTEHCVIRAETDVLISGVLTDEQYLRFGQLRSERNARRGEGRGKGRRHPPLDCTRQLSTSNAEG